MQSNNKKLRRKSNDVTPEQKQLVEGYTAALQYLLDKASVEELKLAVDFYRAHNQGFKPSLLGAASRFQKIDLVCYEFTVNDIRDWILPSRNLLLNNFFSLQHELISLSIMMPSQTPPQNELDVITAREWRSYVEDKVGSNSYRELEDIALKLANSNLSQNCKKILWSLLKPATRNKIKEVRDRQKQLDAQNLW